MREPWEVVLLRGRWAESLLAVVAVVAVTWPLRELTSSQPWTEPLAGVLLLVVVLGSLVRMARTPGWVVVLVQLVGLSSALAWWSQAQRPDGEPAVAAMGALVREGVWTIQNFAVPAPARPGLTFIVLTSIALLALLVEALSVTFRAAAVAGVPLLLVSAAAASGTGQALDPRYFILAAAAWLVLLARQGRAALEDWSAAGAPATSVSVDRRATTRVGYHRLGVTARVMGLVALVLAVAVPGLLPHLPPTVLVDGRSGEGAPGSVSFTETLDLAQDLSDRSNAPVIRYRTDDPSPQPLRVTVSTDYADGSWQQADHSASAPMEGGEIMTLNSLLLEARELESTTATVTVTQNGMRAPQLALPYPTSALDLGEIGLQWDPLTDVALVDDVPGSYEASYFEVAPLATLPEEIGAPPERLLDEYAVADAEEYEDDGTYRWSADRRLLEILRPDGSREQAMSDGTMRVVEADGSVRRAVYRHDDSDPFAVDPASEALLRELAAEVAGDRTNQIDIALAIQRYLRGPDFTYSLTLADPVEGPDGRPLDPISHFLETKQGYCTQFASAMVMMARAQGIPARLAVGFLPGNRSLDGTRTVVAADAHAWPELFVNGLGWTRFEPTPGSRSGAAPFFATEGQRQEVPTADEDPTVEEPTVAPTVPDTAGGQGAQDQAGWVERNAEAIGWTALGLATAAALLSVVPLAGRWRRWRLRTGGAASRIEGEWSTLVSGLGDLGVDQPPAATPRTLRDSYARALDPDPPTLDALSRAADRVESARYAAQPPSPGTMREDVHRVLEWQRHRVTRRRRLRAALLPSAGLTQLRSLAPGRGPRDTAPVPGG